MLFQFWSVLRAFVKLKSFRFLWLFVFVFSAMSNHLLYKQVGSWVGNFGMQGYINIDGSDFIRNGIIVGDTTQYPTKFSALNSLIDEQGRGTGTKFEVHKCRGSSPKELGCHIQLLSLMISHTTNKFSHFVDFSDPSDNQPKIVCNIAYGSENYCPFVASMVNTASYGDANVQHRFRKISVFRYVPIEEVKVEKVRSGTDTMCATDPDYIVVMPRAVIVQAFLLLCSVFIYLLASTVPCIVELKSRDFLLLLFHRGLSVLAYWLALWTVTLIELLLAAGILAASHYFQCPGFYDVPRLIRLMLVYAVQLNSIASLVFLLTVIIPRQFIIGVATLLLASVCCLVLALSLILLHWLSRSLATETTLLLVPPGLLGEQLQAILVAQLKPEKETGFHTLILIMSSCIWGVSLLVTVYLDCVLTSRSGLFARTLYYKLFGDQRTRSDPDPLEPPDKTVEPVADLNPVVEIRKVNKEFVSCNGRRDMPTLTNVSATLYQNQLTAIVGHNGSGKSTLFNILIGRLAASSGDVYISGYGIDSAHTRYSLAPTVSACYQYDALCYGMTVADSIRLTQSACESHQGAILNHILSLLSLHDKLDQMVSSLSTGQRRKLCIAQALLGDPRVIILDEPSSNLDPVSRRQLWKLLQEYRFGRCIVTTTSMMEEADLLADRKIFLSGGSLICTGSSLFLRRAFDCGFIFQTRVKSERHVGWVLRAVHSRFPRVRARSIYRSNIELEVTANDDKVLPGIAETLESMPELVEGFGLTQHSLEQIFNRLQSMPQHEVEELFRTGEIGYTVNEPLDPSELEQAEQAQQAKQPDALLLPWSTSSATYAPSLPERIVAVTLICCARMRRKRSTIFSRIVFPVLLLLLLIGCLVAEKMTSGGKLNLWATLSDSRNKTFTKGLCIQGSAYEIVEAEKILNLHTDKPHSATDRACNELLDFVTTPNTSKTDETYMISFKPTDTAIYSHFKSDVNKQPAFVKYCSKNVGNRMYEPCPIIYASSWCEDMNNTWRDISLGFYSLHRHFKVEVAIENLVGVYGRALRYFSRALARHVAMVVDVAGVNEFRTTFLPLFGIIFQMVILSIIPATYLDDLMEDRTSGVRQQLGALGMSTCHYWICVFVAHWLQYSIVYILSTLLIIAVFSVSYLNIGFLLCIFLPTLLLGLTSNLLLAYLFSIIFKTHNAVLAVVYSIVSAVLALSLLLTQLDSMTGLIVIFFLPPVASVALTFYGSKVIVYAISFLKLNTSRELPDPIDLLFMSLHVKVAILAMMGHIVIFILALFIIEKCRPTCRGSSSASSSACACCRRRRADGIVYAPSDDPSVLEESELLDAGPRDTQHLLELRHLRVHASNGDKIVRDVSFAVKPGEIFGLLGPNGSGKTSVLSAIAGATRPNGGTCEVLTTSGVWQDCHASAAKGSIGYCQSGDPLLSHVTVIEHLKFYSAVLGVPKSNKKRLIDELLNVFHLQESMDKITLQISNGCKRRLSMAISMLGNPSVVTIDDPAEGVDADGRSLIWAAIRSIASENRAVVVSLHSTEEVSNLCSRVGILNHGLLVGIGPINQILNRFGQVHTLSIQLEEDVSESIEFRHAKIKALIQAVLGKFPDAYVLVKMAASALICVPQSNISRMSDVLKWLIGLKKSLNIAYFSMRRVYLDEVFDLIIRNHDDKLLKKRFSIFSMTGSESMSDISDVAAASGPALA